MTPTALRHETGSEAALCVETISGMEGFQNLKPEWEALVAAAGIDHPFLTHEWVRIWLECFGKDKAPYILAVREGAELVGIAPFIQYTQRVYGLKLKRLELPWNPHVPRSDFIIAGHRPDIYHAIWQHLDAHVDDWDMLLLQQIAADSPTFARMQDLPGAAGYLVGVWTSDSSPFLKITGSWEEYFESLPRKFRANLRNRSSRLQKLGSVEMETLQGDGENLQEALDEGYVIEAAAWKGAAGTALLCDEAVASFYSRIATTSSLRENIRLNFLRLKGSRIAFDYCLRYADVMYRLKSGYLPDHAAYSPSAILSVQTMEETFRQGFRKYDFLGKDEEWKRIWCNEILTHYWIFVFPNRPKTALLHKMKFKWLPLVKGLRTSHEPTPNASGDPTEGDS